MVRIIPLLLFLTMHAAVAAERRPATVLMYYANRPEALESFRQNARYISIIAPQIYRMDRDGYVFEELDPEMLRIARRHRVAVMPLVVNRGFDQETIHQVLDDPARRARAIKYLLFYCRKNNYYGIQFDFENIKQSYRQKYTEFFKEAARALRPRGFKLSVAVVGRWSPHAEDHPQAGWENWSGVYDYRALGEYADFVTIMAYPQHSRAGSAGPIAGYEWVKRIIEYSLTEIPRAKLSLGVPLYYTRWSADGARSGGYREVKELISRLGLAERWDDAHRSPWLEFNQDGKAYTLWYEDARSFAHKMQLLAEYRLPGFSAWRIGQEDPAVWREIAKLRIRRIRR